MSNNEVLLETIKSLLYWSWPDVTRGPADPQWIKEVSKAQAQLDWPICPSCQGTGEISARDCCKGCYGTGFRHPNDIKSGMKTYYQVFDNGKPADCMHCNVHKSWANSKFDTWEAALSYARKWLGDCDSEGLVLELNTPVAYDGFGDMIEIREIVE